MGMGVLFAGTPVRRPAGVSHAGTNAGEIPIATGKGAGKIFELPDLSYLLDPALPLQGQPRRIVTTILQVSEALHKHLDTPLLTGVTHYAAHRLTSLSIRDGIREGREGRQTCSFCPRARTVLCPRRHLRDLSPPRRPPEAETYPPNASMNVFLVDSRPLLRESWRFCYLPTRKLRRSHRARWLSTANVPTSGYFPVSAE